MKKLFALFALVALLLPLSASAIEENEIQPVMRQKIDQILTVINDHNLTKAQRNASIEKIIDPFFDYRLMAMLSLGKRGWEEATPQQREEYITLFEHRMKESYMTKIDLYKNEKITLETPQKANNRIQLPSYIFQNGEKKEVLYKFYHSKNRGWLIYDVDVLGVRIIQS